MSNYYILTFLFSWLVCFQGISSSFNFDDVDDELDLINSKVASFRIADSSKNKLGRDGSNPNIYKVFEAANKPHTPVNFKTMYENEAAGAENVKKKFSSSGKENLPPKNSELAGPLKLDGKNFPRIPLSPKKPTN